MDCVVSLGAWSDIDSWNFVHAVVLPNYDLPHRDDEQKVSLMHEAAVLPFPGSDL